MNQISNNFATIDQVTNQYLKTPSTKTSQTGNMPTKSFQEIFAQQQALQTNTANTELKFSKHASERLQSRNMNLTNEQLNRLETGAKKASEKGIKESLVMVDNMAFIINVKNNTVVTAVNEGDEKVFTNIDGAIII